MIKIDKIKKKFNNKEIIKELSLDIKTGEKITIIGPSGCGKSTLLRIVLGLQKIDKGEIYIDNTPLSIQKEKSIRKIRGEFGILFQSGALFDSMNVFDNIAFPLRENTKLTEQEISDVVFEKLDLVEMSGSEKKMPSDLSGGMRKRIGLARAIAPNPKFILYDEPTTGLDPILSTAIENLIVKLNTHLKMTTITVTHQISTILRTAVA